MSADYPILMHSDREILDAADSIIARRWANPPGVTFNSPKLAREFFRARLHDLPAEQFHMAVLDNRHRLLSDETLMFKGTIDAAAVYPREVLRRVMDTNAAAVILAHNHPSGVTDPSRADYMITERIKDTLQMIDVRVLDHIIIGESVYSFAEMGEL